MNKYNVDITISNNIGELFDKRISFATFDDMRIFFSDSSRMDTVLDEAFENGQNDNLIFEEYVEDLSPNSPLNNPANFLN